MQRPRKFIVALTFVLSFSTSSFAQTTNNLKPTNGIITGRVTIKGKGAADVRVRATRPHPSIGEPAFEAKTDERGAYQIVGLPPSNYEVSVIDPGFVPGRNDSVSGSPRAVSVAAGETVTGIDFALVAGGVITGRVTEGGGNPLIEEPILLTEVTPQLNPTLASMNPAMLPFKTGAFRTDDRGIYRIYGIPPGSFLVSAGSRFPAMSVAAGRPTYRQTFFGNATDANKARPLEVASGAVLSNIDINVGATVHVVSASGRVIDSQTQAPVAGVSMDLHIYGTAREGGAISRVAVSNTAGEFNIPRITAGQYSLEVTAQDSRQEPSDFLIQPTSFEVKDADVSGIEVRAERTASVSGVVVVANTNDPVVLAKAAQLDLVFLVNPRTGGAYFSTMSKPDADRSFSVRGLKPGRLVVYPNLRDQVAASGLRFLRMELGGSNRVREIELSAENPVTNLRVVLVYGANTVRGEVKLENGALPPGAKVAAGISDDKGFSASTWVDPNGNFLIEAVPAGNYTLTVEAEDPGRRTLGPETRQSISVADGGVTKVSIVLDLSKLQPPMH